MKTRVKAAKPMFRCPFCEYAHHSLELRNEHIIERHKGQVRVSRAEEGWGAWDYKERGAHPNGAIRYG